MNDPSRIDGVLPAGDGLTPEQKRLIQRAIEPMELNRARIEETLQRARQLEAPRERWRHWRFAAAAMIAVSLIAGGYWKWSGEDSNELPFDRAIDIIANPDGFRFENIRTAQVKLWLRMQNTLELLKKRDELADSTKLVVANAIDSLVLIEANCPRDMDALLVQIAGGEPLTAAQLARFERGLVAGVSAIRHAGRLDDLHAEYVPILTRRLRDLLSDD